MNALTNARTLSRKSLARFAPTFPDTPAARDPATLTANRWRDLLHASPAAAARQPLPSPPAEESAASRPGLDEFPGSTTFFISSPCLPPPSCGWRLACRSGSPSACSLLYREGRVSDVTVIAVASQRSVGRHPLRLAVRSSPAHRCLPAALRWRGLNARQADRSAGGRARRSRDRIVSLNGGLFVPPRGGGRSGRRSGWRSGVSRVPLRAVASLTAEPCIGAADRGPVGCWGWSGRLALDSEKPRLARAGLFGRVRAWRPPRRPRPLRQNARAGPIGCAPARRCRVR